MTREPHHEIKAATETCDDSEVGRRYLMKGILGMIGVTGIGAVTVHPMVTVQGTPPTSEDVRIVTAEGIEAELTDVGLTTREAVYVELDITVDEPAEYHIRLAVLDAEGTALASEAEVETLYDGEIAHHRKEVLPPVEGGGGREGYETVLVRVLPERQL